VSQKPIAKPMIDKLSKKTSKTIQPDESATVPKRGPLAPAELDQDAGSGYNPDGTYPQP
jgi:hypothetical protein